MTVTKQSSAPGNPSPINSDQVLTLLAASESPWRNVTVVASTGSTNADLVQVITAGGAEEGTIIAADQQTAGRGRLGRDWQSPAGSSLSFSVLLRPPMQHSGFVPALAGVAIAAAIGDVGGPPVSLKWPNDVMVSDLKAAGILAEAASGMVVLGCGINVTMTPDQLPVPTATALNLHGVTLDRSKLLAACISRLAQLNERWREAGYDPQASGLLDEYRMLCATIGSEVVVSLPDGNSLTGFVEAVDRFGQLQLRTDDGRRTLSAGDVVHVRPE